MREQMNRPRNGCVKVDMAPVDEILALAGRLDANQRMHLDVRLMSRPGLVRSCFTVWAYLHRHELARELPAGVRGLVSRFWRTIDEICRKHDRRAPRLPRCCTAGLAQAKRNLARRRKP